MKTYSHDIFRGFTLIELLVVIAVLAILISIMQPVLAMVRSSAHGTTCLSNLRSIGLGWSMAMMENEEKIPYTFNPNRSPNWISLLNDIYPNVPNLYEAAWDNKDAPASFNYCPQAHAQYHRIYYTTTVHWGYTINTAWEGDPSDPANSNGEGGHRWSDIKSPGDYPFFMDGQVRPFDDGFNMTHRAPRPPSSWSSLGVGLHHNNGQAGNVWYADGSTRIITLTEIRSGEQTSDPYAWFMNR